MPRARAVFSFLVLGMLVVSEFLYVPVTYAASYSLTWDSQNDFQSNTVSGWATSTVGTIASGTGRIDTTTTAGSFQLGRNASQTVTDNFASGNGHLDFSTTTATVSASTLQRTTTDTFTDITSYISGSVTSADAIGRMRYDATDNKLIFVAGKFSPYDFTTLYSLDLTSHALTAVEINTRFPRFDYDPINNRVVYGENWNTPYLNSYNPATGVKTSLFSKFPSISQYGPQTDVIYNPTDGKFYISVQSWNGSSYDYSLVSYNAANAATSSVTLGANKSFSSSFAENAGYDAYSNSLVWIAADNGKMLRMNSGGTISTVYGSDIFSYYPNFTVNSTTGKIYIVSGWSTGASSINNDGSGYAGMSGSYPAGVEDTQAATYDSWSGDVYYSGCNNQTYGCTSDETGYVYKYNGSTYTSLTTAYRAAIGGSTVPVYGIYSDGRGRVYFGGTTGTLAYATPPASTQIAVSSVLATSTTSWAHATLTASSVTLNGGTVTYQLSNDNGVTWTNVTSGVEHTFSTAGTQLKYKVILTGGATIGQIAVAYDDYTTATLSNLKKDAGADSQWVAISWNVTLPSNTSIVFKTRGATQGEGASALYGKTWSDAYTATTSGVGGTAIKANGPGGASLPSYEYIEVEAILTSTDGLAIPIVNSLSLSYALNAAPDFDQNFPTTAAGGARMYQISTSTDANWGKVQIDYSMEDSDTDSGTANPGFVAPSFEYRLSGGDSWHAITSGYLSAGATSLKSVLQSSYAPYTAYWDAKTQIPTQYSANTQVRVTGNDNEIIYNLGYATTTATTTDTTAPSVTGHIYGSSSTSTLVIAGTDDTNFFDYKVSNQSDGTADGSNGISGALQSTSTAAFNFDAVWTLPTSTTTQTVYFTVRDIYGNTSSSSVTGPAAPSSFEIHDISNQQQGTYQTVVNWTPYTSASGATFARYEVWRSSDASSYSLASTITDASVNYYLDASVSSSTTYYYKTRTIDSDGDSSAFTTVASIQPSGSGGTNIPPNISNVVIDTIRNNSARVTWTTNTLANSVVNYGVTTSYGSTQSSASYVTSHAVYLTGLLPNTTYYVKVNSTDFSSNTASSDNSGQGYSFTTIGGAVISNVTVNSVTDTSANIFWNTDRTADGYVYYSTHSDLSSPTSAGSSQLVSTTTSAGTYSHSVALNALSGSATYYFYVTSTDSDANTTTDNNSGSYYSFLTTRDTTPPVISNISEPVLADTQVVIVWQTDKPATTQVEWGTTASTSDGSYANTTTLDSTLSVTHAVVITDLDETTDYYFRAISSDAAGNRAVSSEQTFTTTAQDVVVVRSSSSSGSAQEQGPTITSTNVTPINSFDATVNVTTDANSRIIIKYGATSSSTPDAPYELSAGDSSAGTLHQIKLSGLLPGTGYHFIVNAIGDTGGATVGTEQNFTTKYISEVGALSITDRAAALQAKLEDLLQSALPSLSPPFMTKPVVSKIGQDSATISWNTNVKAYGVLNYATDEEFGTSTAYAHTASESLSDMSTTHSITLTGLSSDTLYHFSTRAYVFPQVVGKSEDFTFTTEAAPIVPQIVDVKPDSFRVLWTTNAKATSAIDFRDQQTGIVQTLNDTKLSKQHDLIAENLPSGHTFSIHVYGTDERGSTLSTSKDIVVTTGVDTIAPKVTTLRIDSNLVPGRTDIVQSIVSWKTDKPSTSAVYYEEGSGAANQTLKNKVENDTGYVQDHVVLLPNLKPATIYRVQVSSTDKAGNVETLPVRTIVTPQQSESIIDIIFKNFSSTFNFIQ